MWRGGAGEGCGGGQGGQGGQGGGGHHGLRLSNWGLTGEVKRLTLPLHAERFSTLKSRSQDDKAQEPGCLVACRPVGNCEFRRDGATGGKPRVTATGSGSQASPLSQQPFAPSVRQPTPSPPPPLPLPSPRHVFRVFPGAGAVSCRCGDDAVAQPPPRHRGVLASTPCAPAGLEGPTTHRRWVKAHLCTSADSQLCRERLWNVSQAKN